MSRRKRRNIQNKVNTDNLEVVEIMEEKDNIEIKDEEIDIPMEDYISEELEESKNHTLQI